MRGWHNTNDAFTPKWFQSVICFDTSAEIFFIKVNIDLLDCFPSYPNLWVASKTNTAGEAFEKNRLWVAPDFSIKFMRGPMVFFMSGSGTGSSRQYSGADLTLGSVGFHETFGSLKGRFLQAFGSQRGGSGYPCQISVDLPVFGQNWLCKTSDPIFWSGMEQPEICGLSFGPPFMSGLWVAYEWLMRNPCGWQKTSNKYKYLIDVIFKQMIPS